LKHSRSEKVSRITDSQSILGRGLVKLFTVGAIAMRSSGLTKLRAKEWPCVCIPGVKGREGTGSAGHQGVRERTSAAQWHHCLGLLGAIARVDESSSAAPPVQKRFSLHHP
jgi:hypothetical protein